MGCHDRTCAMIYLVGFFFLVTDLGIILSCGTMDFHGSTLFFLLFFFFHFLFPLSSFLYFSLLYSSSLALKFLHSFRCVGRSRVRRFGGAKGGTLFCSRRSFIGRWMGISRQRQMGWDTI